MMQMKVLGNSNGLGAAYTAGGDGTFGGMMGLDEVGRPTGVWPTVWGIAALLSAGASAYHGYKRNDSVGWAVVWGLLGSLFPVITPAIALAQGFAKPKGA